MIYTTADFSLCRPPFIGRAMKVIDKIRWIMSRQDWNQAELAEALGVSQPSVNRWLSGSDPRGETREKIDELFYDLSMANTEHITSIGDAVDDVMDDMEMGPGSPIAEKLRIERLRKAGLPVFRQVKLEGYIGAGGHVEAIAGSSSETIEGPADADPLTVAGIVKGRSMLPAYEEGTILYWSTQLPPEELLNRRCVVQLGDGRIMVKIIRQGSDENLWTLVSLNPAYEDIEDVPVEWAARIDWTKPS